jgi:formylglycine-generating enzyme required for sulfatase activity
MLQNGKVVGLVAGTTKYGLAVTASSIREYLDGNRVSLEEERGTAQVTSPGGSSTKPEPRQGIQNREITGKDGAPMVLIPAGEFTMGSREEDKGVDNDERPAHRVNLDAFYIDQYEVTNSRYAKFFQKTKRAAPEYWSEQVLKQHGNKPVVGVDWSDASAYCAWAKKRLPTEAEWERAARGTDQRLYPWGDTTPDRSLANLDNCCDFKYHSALTEVGSLGRGKSPYGVYDMAGNVWEWVADWYDESYYIKSPERNPNGPSQGILRVVRGGAWTSNPVSVRSAFRDKLSPSYRRAAQDGDLGFRCAKDAKEEVTR